MGDILDAFLKQVCHIYAEQKAIRVEKEIQFQKMARLEIEARKTGQLEYKPKCWLK